VVVPTPSSRNPLVLDVTLKLKNEVFHDDLYNKESLRFLQMKNEVEMEVEIAYEKTKNFLSVTITGFRPGSIVCEGRLYFANATDQDVQNLRETLSDYGTNNKSFEVSKFENAADDGDDDNDDVGDDNEVVLGLNLLQIGAIIAGVVVLILVIIIIVLWVSMCIYSKWIYRREPV
jgi:hypothetical protein